MGVPMELYEELYEARYNLIVVKLTLRLDKGRLVASYPFRFPWIPPSVAIGDGGVLISNKAPVALRFNVTITHFYRNGPSIKEQLSLVAGPLESINVPLDSRASRAYVVVKYSFMGVEVMRAGRVELRGD